MDLRAQELCEKRGGRPKLLVPTVSVDVKQHWNGSQSSGAVWKTKWASRRPEFSVLTVRTVSVDVKQHLKKKKNNSHPKATQFTRSTLSGTFSCLSASSVTYQTTTAPLDRDGHRRADGNQIRCGNRLLSAPSGYSHVCNKNRERLTQELWAGLA